MARGSEASNFGARMTLGDNSGTKNQLAYATGEDALDRTDVSLPVLTLKEVTPGGVGL